MEQRRVDRSVGLVQRTTLFDSSARSYAQPRRPPAFSNIHFLHRSVSSDASIYLFTMFDIHPATRQGQQNRETSRERERERGERERERKDAAALAEERWGSRRVDRSVGLVQRTVLRGSFIQFALSVSMFLLVNLDTLDTANLRAFCFSNLFERVYASLEGTRHKLTPLTHGFF